jgi:hypothetical protein
VGSTAHKFESDHESETSLVQKGLGHVYML